MLAVIPMIFGFNSPLIALNFWLSITLIYFTLLVYSMFLKINFSERFSILSTFLILFGNTAFSVFHILTIDSGSPFILNGYTDSIASIGTFIVVLFFFKNTFFNNAVVSNISVKEVILLFSISVYWNISAPQNSIFLGVLIGLFLIYVIKNKSVQIFKVIKILFLFLVFSGIGIVEGGMFTPQLFKEKLALPGIMEIGKKGIKLNLGIPFHVGIADSWEFGNMHLMTEAKEIKKQLKSTTRIREKYLLIMPLMDKFITNSLKVIFWPLFGILSLIVILKLNIIKNKKLISTQIESDYQKLIFVTFFVFLIGIIFNLFISISGYKWELSRFLILGYFFGMFCLAISLNFLFESGALSKRYLFLIVLIITIGPIFDSFVTILGNIFYTNKSLSFFEKINVMINTFGMVK